MNDTMELPAFVVLDSEPGMCSECAAPIDASTDEDAVIGRPAPMCGRCVRGETEWHECAGCGRDLPDTDVAQLGDRWLCRGCAAEA